MTSLTDFHAEQLILRHCMATEGTADAEYAMQVAKLKDFIRNGTPTQAGRILATLMEVDEFKIRQISERLDADDHEANR